MDTLSNFLQQNPDMSLVAIITIGLIVLVWKTLIFSKVSKTGSGWAVVFGVILPPPFDAVVFLWRNKCQK
jgi:hypothetical protein